MLLFHFMGYKVLLNTKQARAVWGQSVIFILLKYKYSFTLIQLQFCMFL